MDYLQINWFDFSYIFVDMLIAVGLITSLRFLSGIISNVSSTHELSVKDNAAFGIELAGAILALSIVFSGVLSEDQFSNNLLSEGLSVFSYGVYGIILIKLGRFFQDKVVLSNINLREEVVKGNISAAFVDFAHIVATAIVIKAVLEWVPAEGWESYVIVFFGFAVSQLIITIISKLRVLFYAREHKGENLQLQFVANHKALAIRYAGHILGGSLAVKSTAFFVVLVPQLLFMSLIYWAAFAIVAVLVLSLFSALAKKIILAKINIMEEVDEQQNVGIASIESAIVIGIGLLMATIMS